MAAAEGGDGGAVPPREVPPPPGLPDGWKCTLHVYRSGASQGKTYVRFTSPGGQGGFMSIRACIKAHAAATGCDPNEALRDYDQSKETEAEERGKVKEQESLRQELAVEAFRARFGQLDSATVAALPGWRMESYFLESCCQTHRKFIDPQGRVFRLIKDVEALLGSRLDSEDSEGVSEIIEFAKAAVADEGKPTPTSRGALQQPDPSNEAAERAKFLKAMGKREPERPAAPAAAEDAAPAAAAAPEAEAASAEASPALAASKEEEVEGKACEDAPVVRRKRRSRRRVADEDEEAAEEADCAGGPRKSARGAAVTEQEAPEPVAKASRTQAPEPATKASRTRARAKEEEGEPKRAADERAAVAGAAASSAKVAEGKSKPAEQEAKAKTRKTAVEEKVPPKVVEDRAESKAESRKGTATTASGSSVSAKRRRGAKAAEAEAEAEAAEEAAEGEPPRAPKGQSTAAKAKEGGAGGGRLKAMMEAARRRAKEGKERARQKAADVEVSPRKEGASPGAQPNPEKPSREVCKEAERAVGRRLHRRKPSAGQQPPAAPAVPSECQGDGGDEVEEVQPHQAKVARRRSRRRAASADGQRPPPADAAAAAEAAAEAGASTPQKKAQGEEGADASAASRPPAFQSAQKRPRRGSGRGDTPEKGPQPPGASAAPATFLDRWTKGAAAATPAAGAGREELPEAAAAPRQSEASVTPPAPPAQAAGSSFMARWAKAAAAAAAAATAEAEEAAPREPTAEMPTPDLSLPETCSAFRRPQPRGTARRLHARELPDLGPLPAAGVRLPDRVTWVSDRRIFQAMSVGDGKRWISFSVGELGARLALAKALLHAGHAKLLREAPWSTVCSGQSWCDRHGPRLLSDLKPEKVWSQLRAWLQRWGRPGRGGREEPLAALVVGRPGSGKSCGVRLVGRMAHRKVAEYSLDDVEGLRFLDNLLKRQRTARDVTEGKDTVVVLDVPDDPSLALRDRLVPAVRQSPHPVVLTCAAETVESIDAVRKLCLLLEVCPKPLHVARALEELAQREELGPLPESCEAMAAACGGDWRGAVLRLQLLSAACGSGPSAALPLPALSLPAACGRVLGVGSARATTEGKKDGSQAASMDEVCELMSLDASVPSFVQENHLVTVAHGLEEQRALDGCAAAAEALAQADIAAVAAEATAWGGVDEGLAASQGLMLAAVRAVPRGGGGELRTPRPPEPDEPLASPALAARLAAQLGVPKAYVREQVTNWLLQRQSRSLPCSPGRFRLWLARRVSGSFRRGAAGGEAAGVEGAEAANGGAEEEEPEEQGGDEEQCVEEEEASGGGRGNDGEEEEADAEGKLQDAQADEPSAGRGDAMEEDEEEKAEPGEAAATLGESSPMEEEAEEQAEKDRGEVGEEQRSADEA